MSLAKQALRWPLTRAVLGLGLRVYRYILFGSLRFDHDERLHALLRSEEPVLFAVWHQDFVWTLGYLSRFNPRRRTFALASASRDGGLATAAAMSMGYQRPIRGSSARGGRRALLALHRLLRRERDASLVIVCDGPRPPARHLQPGIVHLAQSTGRPIWLLRTSYAKAWVLKRTWAQFLFIHPFSRAAVRAVGPIHVPRDLDRATFETTRASIERRFNELAGDTDLLMDDSPRPAHRPPRDRHAARH